MDVDAATNADAMATPTKPNNLMNRKVKTQVKVVHRIINFKIIDGLPIANNALVKVVFTAAKTALRAKK